MSNKIQLYKNDLPNDLKLGNIIAVDGEFMGLNVRRDPLCLIQISTGNSEAHIIQFDRLNYNAPNLVKIFENTVGYSYIQLLGAGEFANSIFTSPILDQLNDETETKYFNYAFLLTAFDTKNIQQFIQASMNKVGGEQEQTTTTNNLPFNFTLKPLEKDKIEKLEEFVYTKHRIGHFTWVYLTSFLALTVSFISMTMYN